MRLCIVSAKYPFGHKEPFLDTELRALAPTCESVVVFPTSPQASWHGFEAIPAEVVSLPLAGPRTLSLALRAFRRRPRAVFAAIRTLLSER
ncbi:MAG: hypothetical protein QOD51_1370, partial [Candidatus Eremiobacteraeota bacterium]|nr:hypothetical protein [Candidatus Eremiobacteraeota bacterium]